ncbi:MAG: hypothetical protein COA66_02625 [Arcobacter sp.]|nr:MAG: hypothetical protein COA66_02625 [Arcobacter sp.]
MKNFVKYFLIMSLFFTSSLFSKTLKIATPSDLPPYSFVNTENEISGLFIDYWRLWSEKTDVKIKFIPSSWKETIDNIKNKKVDIHSGLFKTKSRKEYLKYLNAIYNANSNIFILKNKKISKISELNGKTLGFIKGTYFETYFAKNYPLIHTKTYLDYKDFKKDVMNNKLDAFIDDDVISWMNIIRYFDYNKVKKIEDFTLNKWFYAAINKNDKKLEKIVLEGMNKINTKDLIKLEKKWIINKDQHSLSLIKENDILSLDERIYLKENPSVSLALLKAWKRMSFYNEKMEMSGFHVDLLKQINKNLNTKIGYKVFDSWSQAYESSKDGQSNGIFGLSWSKEREEFFSYSSAYFFSPMYLVTRKSDTSIKDIENIDNKTAIVHNNSIAEDILQKKQKNVKIIYSNNQIDIHTKIKDKTADFTIQDDPHEYDLKKYKLQIKKTFFLKEGELHIGTKKSDKIFTSIIEKGLSSISKKQMQVIKNKWANKKIKKSVFTDEELQYIKNSPVLNIGIEEWKPVLYTTDADKMGGLAGEILELIFKKASLKIKLVNNNWNNLLNDFKDKKIDILPVVYYVKERESFGLYSDSYLSIQDYIYVKEENKDVSSFEDLKGKKIALVKGYASVYFIKEKFPAINIIETTSVEESILKLINNEVDAIFESQIVVEHKLNELLIKGLRAIRQSEIRINLIHMFSKKDDFILQSILQKSLYLVSGEEKSRIISKWLKKEKIKKELNIIFDKKREPFIFSNSYLKGIEFDLIKEVFKDYKTKINYSSSNYENIYNTFKNNDSFDVISSIKKRDDEFYYSNDFITLSNVFITRVKDNITINSVKDLKDKKIVAFPNAHLFSSNEFHSMFKPQTRRDNYTEEEDHKAIKLFLDKKVDIILMDNNIFKWHLKYMSHTQVSDYKFNYLKGSNNTLKLAFKNENLRNIFNKNLEKIKESGTYQKIINSYILYDKKAKVEVLTLLSKLLSKYIFDHNTLEIKNIINIFNSMFYIKDIEVYDNNNELLYSSSKELLKDAMTFDSFYSLYNLPTKVGYLKLTFNEKLLSSSTLIPDIKKFKNLLSYKYVENIYKEFSYLSNKIEFSKKEKLFIKNNPIITFSETNLEPLVFINRDKISGLVMEYIKIIEDRTSLKFEFIKKNTRLAILKSFENKELDILPSYSNLGLKINDAVLSNIYERFNYILVTKEDENFTNNINDLKNKTLVLPKHLSAYHFIKENYPFIKIIESNTLKEAFELVAKNKTYATIEHSAIASYYIKNFFPSLKITGVLENKYQHSFLVQKDKTELLTIINKVLDSISFERKNEIRHKWIKTKIDTAVDYEIIYEMIFVFVLILLIVLYFLNRISKNKNDIEKINLKLNSSVEDLSLIKDELEDSNEELQSTIENLKQTQEQLIDAEKMASLGSLVAGVAHEINTPIGIGLTGISHLEELTAEISKEYNNQDMTQSEFEEYLDNSKELSFLIHRNLEKAAALVRSFKQVAVDQSSEEKREFNLKKYLAEILQSIHSVTKKSNIKIDISCPNDIRINSYAGAYSQIITNLIMNSLIHGFKEKEKGEISITVLKDQDELQIIYKDNGKGIKKENLSKIFDPFFTTNRNSGGSGLGLNIIYNIIVSRLNGSIKCLSQENKGVEFIILLKV